MKKKKTTKTRLPRLTMLAMSSKELQRFSQAAEQIAGLPHLMVGLMTRLDACVTRLEARSNAARKANKTRQETAEIINSTVIPGLPEEGPDAW